MEHVDHILDRVKARVIGFWAAILAQTHWSPSAIDDVLNEQGSVASCKTTYAKSYRHGGVW